MAALQTQRAGHIGHVKIVAANFHQQHFLLKCFGPLGKRSRRSRLSISSWRRGGAARARQNHPDVRAAHRAFSRQEYEALHYIAEFAHISRPTVAPQLCNRIVGENFLFPRVLRGHLPCEMPDQRREILRPLAQRRKRQRKDIHAVKQIAAERILLHQLFEIAVRRHQHAHVHANGLVSAHSFDLALFQHA